MAKWTKAQREKFRETLAIKRAAARGPEVRGSATATLTKLHSVDRIVNLLTKILEADDAKE